MFKRIVCYIFVLLLTAALSSCVEPKSETTGVSDENEHYGDIERMTDYIEDNHIRINSFILMKDGKTIEEAYFNGADKDTPVPVYSCTKSVISALVGIAIGEGKIKGVDEKLGDLLDLEGMELDEQIAQITLKDLLTMTSGMDAMPSDEFVMKEDAIAYILEQPMAANPGGIFAYTSGGPHLISAILQRATGMETSEYAQIKLFDPLGIPRPEWRKDKKGLAMGGFGLELTPRQLAVFGSLYLNEGVWNGKRIISKEWVEASTIVSVYTAMPSESEQSGYAYLWWMNGFGGYSAHGYAGQYIFVLPDHNSVAVFMSQLAGDDPYLPYRLMKEYVIPALE